MENLFTLLVILIFIFRGLAKLIENAQKQEEAEEPRPEEWEEYFDRIGLPSIEEKEILHPPLSPQPEVKKPPARASVLKTEIKKEKLIPELPLSKLPYLSLDKLREGIILSEILGLPRSKRKK